MSPATRVRVTVVLAARTTAKARLAAVQRLSRQLPQDRRYLSHEALGRMYGARPQSVVRVATFLERRGFTVEETSAVRRTVAVSAPLSSIAAVFGVRFVLRSHPHGAYRSFEGRIRIPRSLARDVTAVLGLDERPLLTRHLASPREPKPRSRGVDPRDVAELYEFPPDATGKHQTVGIITLGAGFHAADVSKYLAKRNADRPIAVHEVGGQKNSPASPAAIAAYLRATGFATTKADARRVGKERGRRQSLRAPLTANELAAIVWTLETTMDVEVLSLLAPDAEVVVYRTANTEQGKFEALMHAITAPNGPSVVSCSWGNHENTFTKAWINLLEEVFQTAALAGVTLCYSSGDDGDGAGADGKPHAHFPASSPHVLACGGTTLVTHGRTSRERAWSETLDGTRLSTGGGVSAVWRTDQAWQESAHVHEATGRHGRGLPDVAAKADFSPGYQVCVGGLEAAVGGGTSAAAPLWAALIARFNEGLGTRCGFVTPCFYRPPCREAFRDVVDGNNGAFSARRGWDACTGLGTPRGASLLSALRSRGK